MVEKNSGKNADKWDGKTKTLETKNNRREKCKEGRGQEKGTSIMDSALCDCKEAEQMVQHIFQDCFI